MDTPLLYLRGAAEMGDVERYATAFRAAGVRSVETALIPDAGHFPADEHPAAVWAAIAKFAGLG